MDLEDIEMQEESELMNTQGVDLEEVEIRLDGNEFNFTMEISRAYKDDNGEMTIEGIASSSSIDQHETVFSQKCQLGFEEDFNNNLPTYIELNHDGTRDFTKRIGKITYIKCLTDNNKTDIDGLYVTQLFVRGILNKDSDIAKEVFQIMSKPNVEMGQPEKLYLSIRGGITEMRLQKIDDKVIEIYDRARLKMIGIVENPSNTDTFVKAVKRSIENDINYKKEIERMSIENNSNKEIKEVERQENSEVSTEVINNVEPEVVETVVEEVAKEEVREVSSEAEAEVKEEVRDTLYEAGKEKNEEVIADTKELMNDVLNEIEKLSDLKSETLISTIKSLLAGLHSKFNWDISYRVFERNFDGKINELMQKEVTRDIESVKTENIESKGTDNEVLRQIETLNKELTNLKNNNETLLKEVERMGNQPVGEVGNVAPSSTNNKQMTFAEMKQAYREGRMTEETKKNFERALVEIAFNK